ncbi:hypothetical protein [Nguyenibacter sp. L1]|uniref:hypothetical protein n=1 Tax=Nguyenibacter sp. L1 TaxID=3049350 RepID=UPI002B470082|nr:hypothetical protein [Nguyenibacter sp. L1]WRH86504.1 hypothetical protein QN315_10710 [Nguyenibacter sp. L1]
MFRNTSCHPFVALSLPVCLAACGYGDSRAAHQAQLSMIGMTANDLQACAGPPDGRVALNAHTSLFHYVYKPGASGSFSISPLNLATLSYGGSGISCAVTIRLVDDRVTEVHYAGDDDRMVGTDGVCAAVVRGCIRQPEATMRRVDGGLFGPISAFSPPPVPPQPADAVYNPQPLATAPRQPAKP